MCGIRREFCLVCSRYGVFANDMLDSRLGSKVVIVKLCMRNYDIVGKWSK